MACMGQVGSAITLVLKPTFLCSFILFLSFLSFLFFYFNFFFHSLKEPPFISLRCFYCNNATKERSLRASGFKWKRWF
ncbi:hypothetical protein I7I53_11403 [Histoplasma capsulatum var. duboisii H88]|uniref:Uncharacterized protein n=1 Tax=Ajellomyces capsulatus (strain H88) TaxID=544711 RepID=A0A8A1LAH3_AJEC8|nr:hypothetical protein I7I53_11403 [Histoplasma capsulatum var. duboisii H88]